RAGRQTAPGGAQGQAAAQYRHLHAQTGVLLQQLDKLSGDAGLVAAVELHRGNESLFQLRQALLQQVDEAFPALPVLQQTPDEVETEQEDASGPEKKEDLPAAFFQGQQVAGGDQQEKQEG